MERYNKNMLYAVTQIKSTLVNLVTGQERKGTGTGFFIRDKNHTAIFVTNKHNIDPSLKIGNDYKLVRLEIMLRKYIGNTFRPETRFIELNLNETRIINAETADVSILVDPIYVDRKPDDQHFSMTYESIADNDYHSENIEIMDQGAFFGFAGSKDSWWDLRWNTPISRIINIASLPSIPFTNSAIKTTDVTLVSGFSFSGSSGSMVLLHQKGLAPGDIMDPHYVPSKIIGIMSGHFKDKLADEPEMFRHSGLSYFTRSTSILDLVSKI